MRHSRHSLAWRARRAIESATASRPLIRRTGPAWAFGALGLIGEIAFAPIVLAATAVIGVLSYLLLDTPWTKVRQQQRPRFVSVRILYLNTLILAGFWLAVMFSFSAADPSLTTPVRGVAPGAAVSTWFDVFLHGIISAVTVNLVLYCLVVARRRMRVLHGTHARSRQLHFDAQVRLFVDGEGRPAL